MLALPAPLAAHLQGRALTLTVCWAITKADDTVIRGTAHDRDVTITAGSYAGVYRARSAAFATTIEGKSDGSVSNLDVRGGLRVDATIDEISVAEIEGGLYDQARAVLLMVNWASPDDGQKVLMSGTLGEFYRDSDGLWRSEVRGLTQALSQQIMRTYSERCWVKLLGDSFCKLDLGPLTRTGTVTAVTSRKAFSVALDAGFAGPTATYYDGGRLAFTSGDNAGFVREVHAGTIAGDNVDVVLWEEAPADIAIGDTISLPPGCDRRYETCRDVHNNLVNFRGWGLYAVGRDRLMKGAS